MLDPDVLVCFPNNVVDLLATQLANIEMPLPDEMEDRIRVEKRPIRDTDYTQTISVIPALWVPDEDSLEMSGGPNEPTIQRYTIAIEALVVDMDEERGLATHALLSSLARLMLYRNLALRVSLPMLEVDLNGYREKLARWGISQQRFGNNQIGKNFVFLSTVDFWFETVIQKN